MSIWLPWVIVLALAAALTVNVALEDASRKELDVIDTVQELPLGTAFPNLVREATTTELDLIVGVAIAAVLWRTGDRRTVLVLLLLFVALPLAQHGLKLLVDRPASAIRFLGHLVRSHKPQLPERPRYECFRRLRLLAIPLAP